LFTLSATTSFKAGQYNAIIIADYNLAKQATKMEELADRPQLPCMQFFMKEANAGKSQ
jgi:hypothetical protein